MRRTVSRICIDSLFTIEIKISDRMSDPLWKYSQPRGPAHKYEIKLVALRTILWSSTKKKNEGEEEKDG